MPPKRNEQAESPIVRQYQVYRDIRSKSGEVVKVTRNAIYTHWRDGRVTYEDVLRKGDETVIAHLFIDGKRNLPSEHRIFKHHIAMLEWGLGYEGAVKEGKLAPVIEDIIKFKQHR